MAVFTTLLWAVIGIFLICVLFRMMQYSQEDNQAEEDVGRVSRSNSGEIYEDEEAKLPWD